jgi:hypothetical protein
MAALELGERAPMPVKQSRKDFRFHFALLQLFIALLVARVIFAIRINRETNTMFLPSGDQIPPSAPLKSRHLMRLSDELPASRIEIAHPDLCWISRFRGPDQPLPVG